MNSRKFIALLFLHTFFFSTAFALEIQKNEMRIFAGTANDKFAYGLSQNKDDQLTATNELHIVLPYFFADLEINSITNRGTKSELSNPATFSSGRYDELILAAGTTIRLWDSFPYQLTFTPQTGFCILGNFGMEAKQNANHKMSKVDEVLLKYEKFDKPFSPIINGKISFNWQQQETINLQVAFASNNTLFYATEQNINLGATFGTKTTFSLLTGYTWNQTHNSSSALAAYKNVTKGFNYGFSLDTGFAKLDYINYPKTHWGLGTISIDFMKLTTHNWEQTDLNYFTGACYIFDTEFLENQLQSKSYNNFSVYFNNKYVSGFKTNDVNPSPYRYERDYLINTLGVKYEIPLDFIQSWVTPYVELGTGIATFGLQKLANQLADADFDSYKYKTKSFWQFEANFGLDIIPQGLLNFGNASYSVTVYAGTLIIPEYKKAGAQIKNDTYRATGWQLNPFEFEYGFNVHIGLDF